MFSVVTFGTIGIFVEYIPMPSGAIAFVRGAVGALCLLVFALVLKIEISIKAIKANLLILTLSGGAIGFNWIFLFEAYRYTTVATATLCYYMAPIFVMLASPLFLKEKLTAKKLGCVFAALLGMVFVSGILDGSGVDLSDFIGVLFGLAAATLYATVVLLNKKLGEISAHNRTVIQLSVAAIVVLPYTLLAEEINMAAMSVTAVILLACVGVLHTGVAYLMYFGSMKGLSAQTVAVFSYIDPVVAIILSAVILRQPMNIYSIIGAILIILSALISELPAQNK
jgi:drug/metabolite transporter (DMT)-like permease